MAGTPLDPSLRSMLVGRSLRYGVLAALLFLAGAAPLPFLPPIGRWMLLLAASVLQAVLGFAIAHRHQSAVARAVVDPCTGLANRSLFRRRMDREGERAERAGTALALLVVDLDGLKAINEAHGHTGGDRALCTVATVLRRVCRAGDLALRWGGDEFVLIAPGIGGSGAMALARRIRSDLEAAAPGLTVSIGAAASQPGAPVPPRFLFEAADRALFVAKRAGRNRAVLAMPSDRGWGELEPTHPPTGALRGGVRTRGARA